jgi:hypothetical protein
MKLHTIESFVQVILTVVTILIVALIVSEKEVDWSNSGEEQVSVSKEQAGISKEWVVILKSGERLTVEADECMLVRHHKLGSNITFTAQCWEGRVGFIPDFEIEAIGVYPISGQGE